ncbi:MCM10 minichromosome maintenance deficient 10 [Rhynchospora pubera]|uniref:MCM10 minichromosome maintenance deficient 10 n=1 Tax=Rhynchospora pubera TaxID=906938 RepID=A0AAV8GEU5_9POAL|nr:MCM10 minichromosome maintenance deficient 10 [Rhynchospora pubera]
MAANGDDLDLLLSLREDRVLETPPDSPSYDGSPKRRSGQVDMSVFRDAVKDYLNEEASTSIPPEPKAASTGRKSKSNKWRGSDEMVVEKFSGLRIRNPTMSSVELSNHFADIRFVRLSAIKNVGDSISGCWATIGIILEKGTPRVSSSGKSYSICKIGSLDGSEVSVFLFDDSHVNFSSESVGAVFAFFNCNVRRDNMGKGFSMSVNSASQMVKLGVSADLAICKGKRKDAMACTMVINKCKGSYCKFHCNKASEKYTSGRAELKGGNFQRTYRPPEYEGVYMVDPERSCHRKTTQQVKHVTIEGLKKALSKADKVTTRNHSQGIRFLSHVTTDESKFPAKNQSEAVNKKATGNFEKPQPKSTQCNPDNNKRSGTSVIKIGSKRSTIPNKEPQLKREKTCNPSEKMIEIDIASSDEEDFWSI